MPYQYEKPKRRLGVRIFNSLGRSLRRIGLTRPLDADEILAKARRKTKLEDWGGDDFIEGLRVFVASLESEARLNPFGRRILRLLLVLFVMNRLKVQYQLTADPTVAERLVSRPIFVVGLPRTGTTLLARLLAMDPAARPLLTWETFAPALGPGQKDRRPLRAKLIVWGINRLTPGIETVHPLDAMGDEEDTWLLANTMLCGAFTLFGRVPSYFEWLLNTTAEHQRSAYQFYRSQLQVLQGSGFRKHWVVKSPAHSATLGGLLEVFPDACVIRTTRPEEKVLPSACSLVAVSRSTFSDEIRPEDLGGEIQEQLITYDRTIDYARQAAPDAVMDLAFEDFLADPVGSVRHLYTHFGLNFTPHFESRLTAWASAPPPPPKHVYEAGRFGLEEPAVRRKHSRDS